jgi:hypothetical protein
MCASPICNISLLCCKLSSSGHVKSKLKFVNMLDKHVYLYFLKVAGLDPAKVLKKMKVISTLIRTNKLSQK